MKKLACLLILTLAVSLSCSGDDGGGDEFTVERLSRLALSGSLTDVWGYMDDATGKEYAIVGFGLFLPSSDPNSGFHIVDVTDASNPVLVATVSTAPGFDVKVWQNYVYAVDGRSTGDGAIVDISNPSAPVVVGTFPSSHNVFISSTGFMFQAFDGQPNRISNLNIDPKNPVQIWKGGSDSHDSAVIGNRWYDFSSSSSTNIYDVTDPLAPRLLSTIDSPDIALHHSGWPTEDGRFLFICDELADSQSKPADFTVWDISDLNDPKKVGEFADQSATVHNLYIIGDFAYVAYYNAGFRVFDVSDPAKPTLVDEFDTSAESGSGFDGAFGVYPFAPSGNIYVSDKRSGLNVFSFGGLQPSSSTNLLAP